MIIIHQTSFSAINMFIMHILELTKSEGRTASSDDDIKILVNANHILKIEDTADDYAGDTKITFIDGSTLYICESLAEIKSLIQ